MEAVWGKADKLDAQIKAENAKAADARVQKAKNLLAERKKDEAKKVLERVVDLFPKTPGAAEAKKMLEKLGNG
jgi:TolA-binding protein